MTQALAILGVGIAISLESGTAQVIISPPTTLQKKYSTTYDYKKYLRIEQYNIHIIGTATVSDWFMRESYWMIINVMGAMRTEHRAKFWGHQALLITNLDPDLKSLGLSPYAGHRNTGDNGWSMFNEAMVCTTAVDTIRPYDTPVFRGWETPIHEFGHAIELTLGLSTRTAALRKANLGTNVDATPRERYAWAVENWFATKPGWFRLALPSWERNYLAEVFNINNSWIPTYTQRPTAYPVGPLGFTVCAGENGFFKLPSQGDVAFGANGKFNYSVARTGSINFNVSTFGDPCYGVLKNGFCRLNSWIIPPAGYIYCAGESGAFNLPGASDVAYGSHGNFRYLHNKTGSVYFSTGTFGDPNIGVLKGGFYKIRPFSTAPVGPANYTWCSMENGSFTLPGFCDVAYGANGKFVYKTGISGTVTFNNSTYGPDPIGGVAKSGFYRQTAW